MVSFSEASWDILINIILNHSFNNAEILMLRWRKNTKRTTLTWLLPNHFILPRALLATIWYMEHDHSTRPQIIIFTITTCFKIKSHINTCIIIHFSYLITQSSYFWQKPKEKGDIEYMSLWLQIYILSICTNFILNWLRE